jgi:hypothetical protein
MLPMPRHVRSLSRKSYLTSKKLAKPCIERERGQKKGRTSWPGRMNHSDEFLILPALFSESTPAADLGE